MSVFRRYVLGQAGEKVLGSAVQPQDFEGAAADIIKADFSVSAGIHLVDHSRQIAGYASESFLAFSKGLFRPLAFGYVSELGHPCHAGVVGDVFPLDLQRIDRAVFSDALDIIRPVKAAEDLLHYEIAPGWSDEQESVHADELAPGIAADIAQALVAIKNDSPVVDPDPAERCFMQGPEPDLALPELLFSEFVFRDVPDHAVDGNQNSG